LIPPRRPKPLTMKQHHGGVTSKSKAKAFTRVNQKKIGTRLKGIMDTFVLDVEPDNVDFGECIRNQRFIYPISAQAADDLSTASGLLTSPMHVYTFELHGFSTLSSNASGVISSFIPFDPSSSGFNFSEWSTLSSLFSEYRLKSFHVQFVGAIQASVGQLPLAIASNLSVSVAPSSTGTVIANADAKLWFAARDTSPTGYMHSVSPTDILWAATATPTSVPYAGAPGSIQIYGDNQTATSNVGRCLVRGIYEFRSRD